MKALVLPVALFAASAGMTFAEDGPRAGDRARTFLVLRIAESLELGDAEALQVAKHLRASGDRRRALRQGRKSLAGELRAAIEAEDNEKIDVLVGRALTIDRQLSALAVETFDEIGKGLTAVQRGKLALLVPEMQRQLRRGARRSMRERKERRDR